MDQGDLNREQRQAVEHGSGPLLVVAGAGTGKTEVITRRVAHLIMSGQAQPDEVLALTFTDKAAREMEERVDRLLPYGLVQTQIITFQAFGERLLRQYALDIGLPLSLNLMTRPQQLVFLRQHIDDLDLDYFAPIASPDSYLTALANYFSKLRNELVTPVAYLQFAGRPAEGEAAQLEAAKHLELARAFERYTQLKRAQGLIDFDDQIHLVLELFEQRPNVLATIRQRFRYVMVDEFQDTNLAQNRLLEMLCGPKGNLTVVGDDDQSIYKFRGAAVSNIVAFTQRFKKVKTVVLTRNYRSTQAILDAAYRLIQHNNPDRLEAQQSIVKRLKSARAGRPPGLITAATLALEAEALAQDISQKLSRGLSVDSMAILVRKRNQIPNLLPGLTKAEIPFQISEVTDLYSEPEIRALLYFLQILSDPTDSISLYHLLSSEVYHLDPNQLAELAGVARRRHQSFEQVIRSEGAWADMVGQLDSWRQRLVELTVGQMAFDFITSTGYLRRLTQQSKSDHLAERKLKNLGRFFAGLADYERVADDKSVLAYVLNLRALREAGDTSEGEASDLSGGAVRIMTIHQAKGLEFDTVYLVDLSQGSFPGANRSDGLEVPVELVKDEIFPTGDYRLQEERRLMYVAMTRAKQQLYLTFSPDHGGRLPKKPSQFIFEALDIAPQNLRFPGAANPVEVMSLFDWKPTARLPTRSRFVQDDYLVLTPHQIDDYLSCPENFRYRYILEVPEPPIASLMYGRLIHTVISQYFGLKLQGKAIKLEQLFDLIDELWRSEGFLSLGHEERRYQAAKQTVKRFFEREEQARRLPEQVEQDFKFDLPEIKVRVKGRFDAVYTRPNLEIRDFKTSQVVDTKKANDKAHTNLQLAIYALAWQRLTGEIPAKVTLDFIDTGLIGEATKSAADLQQTIGQIAQVATGIREGYYEAGENCFYCSHPKTNKFYV